MKLTTISREEAGEQWRFILLGTGDSMGVPRVYCECKVCQEARLTGKNRRLRSSVLLYRNERMLLIDCGPDWTLQMEMAEVRWLPDILITHAHYDHIAGLPAYADACRWLKRRGRVRAPQEVLDLLMRLYPWLVNQIEFIPIESSWQWEEWKIIPIRVNHGKNGYSYAYRFEREVEVEGCSETIHWAYASDAIDIAEEQFELLKQLNVLVLGTSFYQEPYPHHTRSVYDMVEAVELLKQLHPKQAVFTHMSHGIDLTTHYPLPNNVQLGCLGLTVQV